MKIKEKWYDGKYYSNVRLIQEENTTEKPYWGIENASLTIESPSSSLSNALRRSGFSIPKQVTLIEQRRKLDSYDKEIIARIAASGLLTQKQLIDYMKQCNLLPDRFGSRIESNIMQRRLNHLFTSELIEKVIISYSNDLPNLTAYRITRLGEELARRQGVCIHSGNKYRSRKEREMTGLFDTPEKIMRVIVANNIALRLLNENDNIKSLKFMVTHRIKGVNALSSITRSDLTIVKEDGSSYFIEIFRRSDTSNTSREQYESYIKDKVGRYFDLVQHDDFLEKNIQDLKTIPKLVIVAEDLMHLDELKNMITPIVNALRKDDRTEVVFITDYGLDTEQFYHSNSFNE